MRTGTVKLVLKDKIDTWLKSITDSELKAVIQNNVLITGGAITSLLQGEKPNDYDMYFKTKEAARAVAEYYVKIFNDSNKLSSVNRYNAYVKQESIANINNEIEDRILIYMQSAGVASETQTRYEYFEGQTDSETEQFFESMKNVEEEIAMDVEKRPIEIANEINNELSDKTKPRFRPVFMTDNAITLSDKVQLIIRFFGPVEKIHKNFDFAHAMACYDYYTDTLTVPQETYESILSKYLIYNGSLYPIATLFRMRKFMARGWRITAGQMLKVAFQISEMNLTDPKLLKEQLIGVDFAYMRQLIHAIENKEPGTKIDSIYIAKLIDEIFE